MTNEGELLIIKLLTAILHAVYTANADNSQIYDFTYEDWRDHTHDNGNVEEAINAGYRYIENREAK